MKEALCVAIGGILGALISAAINAFANYKIKVIEQKLRRDDLAIQAGIKEYECMSEIARAKNCDFATPRYWIYHMIISLNRFLDIDTSDFNEVEAALQKDKTTTTILAKHLCANKLNDDSK